MSTLRLAVQSAGLRRGEDPGGFPGPEQTVHGKPLVYLDSAATAQKPQAVIDAIRQITTRSRIAPTFIAACTN